MSQNTKKSAVNQNITINMEEPGSHNLSPFKYEFKKVNPENLEIFIRFLNNENHYNDSLHEYDPSCSLVENLKNILFLDYNDNLGFYLAQEWNRKVFCLWNEYIQGKYTITDKFELHDFARKMNKENKEFSTFIFNGMPYTIWKREVYDVYSEYDLGSGEVDCDYGPDDDMFVGELEDLN